MLTESLEKPLSLQTKVYDSALRSRLEPSKEQQCQAREFQAKMRLNGFLIVYSMETNSAELTSMQPAILRREGIQQKRLTAEDKAAFAKFKDVLSMDSERTWLRAGLTKAQSTTTGDDKPLDVFNEALRVFPGARLVERNQGNFIDKGAKRP